MTIQEKIRLLAEECRADMETYHEYHEQDIMDATFVFMHVFVPMVYDEMGRKGLSMSEKAISFESLGVYLKETIKLATGVDLTQVELPNNDWPEEID